MYATFWPGPSRHVCACLAVPLLTTCAFEKKGSKVRVELLNSRRVWCVGSGPLPSPVRNLRNTEGFTLAGGFSGLSGRGNGMLGKQAAAAVKLWL